jgi:hypothetical protein
MQVLTREQIYKQIKQLPPEDQAKAAAAVLERYGPAPQSDKFEPYKFAPEKYIENFLGWTPWSGYDEFHPGQVQILQACALSVKQQLEKRAFEKGEITEKELTVWRPDAPIQNWIRVESGNGIGKTKSISGVVNWFFDCFDSIVYTFHATATQDKITTWKEIRKDRTGKNLPGTILKTQLYLSSDRFAISRSPSDAGGTGEENTKGQHNEFLFFVIDEADGAKEFIFEGIETMLSGGIGVVLMTANPRSRGTYFHRLKAKTYVQTMRISTLYHPNVVENQEVIKGAVKRGFVEREIENGCEIVTAHNEENFTFDLPYSVRIGEKTFPAGTIFKPSRTFMTRVLGIAPPNAVDNTLVPVGIFEAAVGRAEANPNDPTKARMGVDVARGGVDNGTLYVKHAGEVWRAGEFEKEDTNVYARIIKAAALDLAQKGVTSLHIRIDGGGGFGGGVIDKLKIDDELIEAFKDFKCLEVFFNGTPYNSEKYKDLITEMMAETAESLKTLKIIDPPERLEIDLCEREYEWRNVGDLEVKKLEPKEKFKKRKGHSPDDGDGFVLAVAPDYLFKRTPDLCAPVGGLQTNMWSTG